MDSALVLVSGIVNIIGKVDMGLRYIQATGQMIIQRFGYS